MDIHKYFVEIIIHNYSYAYLYETKISAVECSIGSMKGQHQIITKMQIQYADCASLQIRIISNTISKVEASINLVYHSHSVMK